MMKDSKLDPNWLRQMMQANPPQQLANGNFLTGPVRLNFPNILETSKDKLDNGVVKKGKFGATIMFPLGADLTVLSHAWLNQCKLDFAQNVNPATGEVFGLHTPFHDQSEKAFGAKPYAGFTPGAIFINVSSMYKPDCRDAARNPIVDPARVYAGVWAIVALNLYKYGVNPPQPKKGVGFGIQSLLIIADDDRILGGGGGNADADFAGVTIDGTFNATQAFAAMPGMAAPTQYGAAAVQQTMPGNYVGQQGTMPIQPIAADPNDISDLW